MKMQPFRVRGDIFFRAQSLRDAYERLSVYFHLLARGESTRLAEVGVLNVVLMDKEGSIEDMRVQAQTFWVCAGSLCRLCKGHDRPRFEKVHESDPHSVWIHVDESVDKFALCGASMIWVLPGADIALNPPPEPSRIIQFKG